MKKIIIKEGQQKLTKYQEKYLKWFAKKQIEKYLSTKQTLSDKQINICVNNAYKVSGLDIPKKIRWFKSPEEFCKHWDSVRDSVRNSVWDSVWNSVRDSVWDSVWDSVRNSVRAYYDGDDLSFYRLFNNYFKENDLVWLSKISENVTGYGFYKNECWLARKPTILTRDEEGRLHGENKMAIKWAGGTGYYFYHGVKASKKIIETPEKLNKKDWLKESNTEVRRIIQERMTDFVKKIGGKLIDKSERAELYEVDINPDPEEIAKYIKVKDASTSRVYWLRVPPRMKKADTAVAWTFGLRAKVYNPKKET